MSALVASLPKSGRTTAQLFAAALGRLPTAVESRTLQVQLGANPTPQKLKEHLNSLVPTPEFLKHVNSLINRVNGKEMKDFESLVPNLGLK